MSTKLMTTTCASPPISPQLLSMTYSSSQDPEDEILWPRCLELELEVEWLEVELDTDLMKMDIIEIEAQEEVSVMTMTDEVEVSRSIPSLEFVLAPLDLEAATKWVCRSVNENAPDVFVSQGDLNVLGLQHLPLCSVEYKTKACACVQMSHFASPDYQDDIRKLYCMICREGNPNLAQTFLMSMMIDTKSEVAFLVPGFYEGRECQKFWLCRAQFCNLFGLSEMDIVRMEWNAMQCNSLIY